MNRAFPSVSRSIACAEVSGGAAVFLSSDWALFGDVSGRSAEPNAGASLPQTVVAAKIAPAVNCRRVVLFFMVM